MTGHDSKLDAIIKSITKKYSHDAVNNINEIVAHKLEQKLKNKEIPSEISGIDGYASYVKGDNAKTKTKLQIKTLLDLHHALSDEQTVVFTNKPDITEDDKVKNSFISSAIKFINDTYVKADDGIMNTEKVNVVSHNKNVKMGLSQANINNLHNFMHDDDVTIITSYVNQKDKTKIDTKLVTPINDVITNDTHYKNMPKSVATFIDNVLSGKSDVKCVANFKGKYDRKSMTLADYKAYASRHSTRTSSNSSNALRKIIDAYIKEHLSIVKNTYTTGRNDDKGSRKRLNVDMVFSDDYKNSWVSTFDRNTDVYNEVATYILENSTTDTKNTEEKVEKAKLELSEVSIIKAIIEDAISTAQKELTTTFATVNADGKQTGGCTVSKEFKGYMITVTDEFVVNLISSSIINANYNKNKTLNESIINGTFLSIMNMHNYADIATKIVE